MVTPLNVLQTDKIMDRYAAVLTASGTHHWTFASGMDPSRLAEAARTADVIVAAAMTPGLARAATRLRLVHVTGAGYDRIPLADLGPGVRVVNTFHHGRSIAEYVLAATIMLARGVPRAESELRHGVWRSVLTDPGVRVGSTLRGRTVGLIGLGEIGAETARLMGAVGARVRAVRARPSAPVPDGVTLDRVGGIEDLDELLAASDVVVVTVPLGDATRGLIGTSQYATMRRGALLINVARGPVLDEAATFAALSEGVIAGAALDVWWGHPREGTPPASHDFATLPNVLLTPHQAGHTDDTFRGRAADIAATIDDLAAGRPLRNVVH
ncbi:2-hydroxyacid dehydrogenase [Actinoplanes derwentensis]|uniref:Phosphoglycerate dehydrogenase n=1 Tax=Actinoplanes derwentensis TaxID=113562 RepID=A0A1H1TJP5_9ACTN|nr:2-hydroxyacid dehydrogenase [Actinoplanes derwentensis]GID85048.1 2-hydroxyacid dehydrogenase [Actinoplanes derwentensis]SDS60291.1 Phosphoglycerate dehydrogenase [Actinoplanes derwentensis]